MNETIGNTATDATPLSVMMRTGSQAEHTAAESSVFMAELLAGRVDEGGYAAYLARYARVYAALERAGRALRAAGDPIARAVADPALERLDAIEADLAYWRARAGQSARGRAPASDPASTMLSPAATAYAERIASSTAVWAGYFVAHHYTRYLGDLSGGQAIGRILARTFNLAEGEGTLFYRFADVPKPKRYKDAYRAAVDALAWTEADKRRIVEEVKVAFDLNSALFAELSAGVSR